MHLGMGECHLLFWVNVTLTSDLVLIIIVPGAYLLYYLRYIAFENILICLTGDCFINKLKLRDPIKSYTIVPSIRLQWIFTYPSM